MAPSLTSAKAIAVIVSLLSLHNNLMHEGIILENQMRRLKRRREFLRRRKIVLISAAVALASTNSSVRSQWSLPKGQWYETILPYLPDDVFRMHFRMHRYSFENLVAQIGDRVQKKDAVRASITPTKRIAAALFRICSSCELRTVAELFGIGISTIHCLVDEFVIAIAEEYYHTLLCFPAPEDMEELAQGFKNMCGFPMAIGAIDGCHIPISPPKAKAVDYYNFKGWYSVILFAVVDYKYAFRYISIGHPGRNHDAFIYMNSSLKRQVIDKGLLNCRTSMIVNTPVPYVLLADSAFPLTQNLMKPFPQRGQLTPQQAIFNRSLSSGRRVVENAFGRLKARFRVLGRRLELRSLQRVKNVIKACVLLHNLLESWEDPVDSTWVAQTEDVTALQPDRITTKKSNSGVDVRSAIANFLYETT